MGPSVERVDQVLVTTMNAGRVDASMAGAKEPLSFTASRDASHFPRAVFATDQILWQAEYLR